MHLVDERHKKEYYYSCFVSHCSEKELKHHTIGTLRQKIEENSSILDNVRKQTRALRKLLCEETTSQGLLGVLRRVFNVVTCYIFSPIRKAKKGISQLNKNKILLKANIATFRHELDLQQREEISKWWEDNFLLIQECFVDASLNRCKAIVFEFLNKRFRYKSSRYKFVNNLQILRQHLQKCETKIMLKFGVEDELFIKALVGDYKNEDGILGHIKSLMRKSKAESSLILS